MSSVQQFQSAFLETLYLYDSADQIREKLRENPELRDYEKYVDEAESPMLEVAAELIKKWGVRHENDPD